MRRDLPNNDYNALQILPIAYPVPRTLRGVEWGLGGNGLSQQVTLGILLKTVDAVIIHYL